MPRIALLVDGDNIAASCADLILTEARSAGQIDFCRVYACQVNGWAAVAGMRFIYSGSDRAEKNATDMLICIDAMELALTGGIEKLVIASSDRDFTQLALRLREGGIPVLGLGAQGKASAAWQAACSEFRLIIPARDKPPAAVPALPLQMPTALDLQLRDTIRLHSPNGPGLPIVLFGQALQRHHGLTLRDAKTASWRRYLTERPWLYKLSGSGAETIVSYLPEGFRRALHVAAE